VKTLVFLRSILNPDAFIVNRRTQQVFVNREEYITNPADRCALEAALKIAGVNGYETDKRMGASSEIVAVSAGPVRVETGLREALALGVRRASRIDLDDLDEAALARTLARVVHLLGGIDLVLLGDAAPDTGGDQVGLRLAEELGWRFIGNACSVRTEMVTFPQPGRLAQGDDEFASSDAGLAAISRAEAVVAVKYLQGGWTEVETQLPAVVTLPAGAIKPRLPGAARLINAFKAKGNVTVLSAAELGLTREELEPSVKVTGRVFPPEREPGRRLKGSVEEIAATLATILQRFR